MTDKLYIPPGMPANPTTVEKLARRMPIIGWIVANEIEKRRLGSIADAISKQLESRASSRSLQDVEMRDTTLGRFMASSIQKHLDWPNDRFIDDDDLALLFVLDDGIGIEVFRDVVSFLRLPAATLSADFIAELEQMSLGDSIRTFLRLSSLHGSRE